MPNIFAFDKNVPSMFFKSKFGPECFVVSFGRCLNKFSIERILVNAQKENQKDAMKSIKELVYSVVSFQQYYYHYDAHSAAVTFSQKQCKD